MTPKLLNHKSFKLGTIGDLCPLETAHSFSETGFVMSFERLVPAIYAVSPNLIGNRVRASFQSAGDCPQRMTFLNKDADF